jgi:hypothetical protein
LIALVAVDMCAEMIQDMSVITPANLKMMLVWSGLALHASATGIAQTKHTLLDQTAGGQLHKPEKQVPVDQDKADIQEIRPFVHQANQHLASDCLLNLRMLQSE